MDDVDTVIWGKLDMINNYITMQLKGPASERTEELSLVLTNIQRIIKGTLRVVPVTHYQLENIPDNVTTVKG